MKSDKYMGMDVHQATTVVAVIDAEAKIVLETIVATAAAPIRRLIESISWPLAKNGSETAIRDDPPFCFAATQSKRVITTRKLFTMERMDISKDDAIAHLAKWLDAETTVRAVYTSTTGNLSIVGKITSLSPAAIRVAGSGSEMLLYLRATSLFDYKDARQVSTEANKDRANKYPTVIDIKFSNGERLVIVEYFSG
jgi:hypothetical protein